MTDGETDTRSVWQSFRRNIIFWIFGYRQDDSSSIIIIIITTTSFIFIDMVVSPLFKGQKGISTGGVFFWNQTSFPPYRRHILEMTLLSSFYILTELRLNIYKSSKWGAQKVNYGKCRHFSSCNNKRCLSRQIFGYVAFIKIPLNSPERERGCHQTRRSENSFSGADN